MKNLDKKSGLGYFNFPKMVKKTSEKFAKLLDLSLSKENIVILKVEENDLWYRVYLFNKDTGVVIILNFGKIDKKVSDIYTNLIELNDVMKEIKQYKKWSEILNGKNS